MTREKWNRLRRQRPELFKKVSGTSWEKMTPGMRYTLRKMTTSEIIGRLSAALLRNYQDNPFPVGLTFDLRQETL